MRSFQCVVPRHVLRQSFVGRVGVPRLGVSSGASGGSAVRRACSAPRSVLRGVLLDLRASRSAGIAGRLHRRRPSFSRVAYFC